MSGRYLLWTKATPRPPNYSSCIKLFLPVENIEKAVQSQEENYVSRDILHVIKFGYHVKLGQNGEGLEPPGKSLEDSIYWPLGMQD